MAIGPITGTLTPMAAQTCIVTKSPLTFGPLNSYAGGFLGPEIRFAGYNAIVIEGKSPEKCFITIKDGEVNILNAGSYWGLTTSETQKAIRKDLQDSNTRIACIGPAGENLVRFASVLSDSRAFGRGGAGAIFASKNLKAIAIRGSGRLTSNDRLHRAIDEAKEVVKNALTSEWSLLRTFSEYGTGGGGSLMQEKGIFATRNHKEGSFEGYKTISWDYYKNLFVKHGSCFACPVHCWKTFKVKEGIYAGTIGEPEYETNYALGSNCGNKYAEAIVKADLLCDDYGMDTLSTGLTISFAMECYEKGIFSKDDTDNIDLRFGNYEAIIDLIERMTFRKGLGDMLAEGTRRVSKKIGKKSEDFAMQVKGMEFAAWMPSGMKGMALNFATSNRGACHKRGIIADELFKIDRLSYDGKAQILKERQDFVNAMFTMIMCRFTDNAYSMEHYCNLINAALGFNFNTQEFLKVGERIWNLERVFSGFTRADDILPKRSFTEPIPKGPSAGQVVDPIKFEKILNEYYSLRGWNKEGRPTKEKLLELGLI
jgi:aldehyde:ferredoxin oxidoreductase